MSNRYILLDSRSTPLARGYLENPPDASIWYLRLLDDTIENVLEHELFQLVSLDEDAPTKLGRILRTRENVIVLEIIETLKENLRENLRVMAKFDTFIYPGTGKWKGRIRVLSHDLSCRGIAFFCEYPLENAEVFEIVIPITEHPLILRAQVIRQRLSSSKTPLYDAKFLDMVNDEEALVREAVFGQQIQNRNKHSETVNTI